MSSRLLAAVLLLVFAAPLMSAPPKSDDRDPKRSTRSVKKKPPRGLAFKTLRTVVKNAVFKDMTFEEFTEWLARQGKANVIVRWKVIEDAGIDVDKLINLKLHDVTVRQIIELVFEDLAAGLDKVELAAKADDNTIIISTKRDLYKDLVTRTYDIQDLLIVVPDFAAQGAGTPTGRSTPGAGLSAGRQSQELKSGTPEELAQSLINIITSQIEPESWAVNGGKGTIAYFKGRLVIRNNLIVHELIGGPGANKPKAPSPPSK